MNTIKRAVSYTAIPTEEGAIQLRSEMFASGYSFGIDVPPLGNGPITIKYYQWPGSSILRQKEEEAIISTMQFDNVAQAMAWAHGIALERGGIHPQGS